MLLTYIFWAHACYLLLQDLSKCAEKGKTYSTYLSTVKPRIILLGCQLGALWAPHSPIIFKSKTQFPTQPQDKASPATAVSGGVFSLIPTQHYFGHRAINHDGRGSLRSRLHHTSATPVRSMSAALAILLPLLRTKPNRTPTNLHRQLWQQLLVATRPRAGSHSLGGRVCVWPSLPSHSLSVAE